MARLNLSLDDVGNCEETTGFILKNQILNLAYTQGLSFEKSKQPDKFRASKTRKRAIKASKSRNGNKF